MNKDNLLPDIYDYLESVDLDSAVANKDVDDIVNDLVTRTHLTKDVAKIIVETFFQEIRNNMLRGNIIKFHHFGNLYVASPKNKKSKKRIFAKFAPSKSLLNKMNKK